MTTSEEGKKLKNVEPHWQPDGLLNIASERYAKRKETLADVLLLAERLSADNPSDAAAVERLIELVEHGRRLAVSLLTACKATQTQQAKNSRVPAERTDLLHATERLEALAERARNWGRVFPKDLEGRPAGEWLEFEEAAQSRVILRPTEADRRIEEPLGALYTHLKSSMKIMVQMPDGTHPTVMSCSSAESYLKNSTDTATRRQVFGAYNAWFAENAAPFAALLNAMTGHRLNLSDRAGMSMLDASLKSERMSRPAFDAMMRAVRAAAPRAAGRAFRSRTSLPRFPKPRLLKRPPRSTAPPTRCVAPSAGSIPTFRAFSSASFRQAGSRRATSRAARAARGARRCPPAAPWRSMRTTSPRSTAPASLPTSWAKRP